MQEAVQKEVKSALEKLGDFSVYKLKSNVSSWNDKPKFEKVIVVNAKRFELSVKYDTKSKIGKIFGYVDKGTGERGGGEKYDIYPKNKRGRKGKLVFTYPPHNPKTLPIPPIPGIVKTGGPTVNVKDHVTHPGIWPRNFSKNLKELLSDRSKAGGFKSTVDAAIKRAYRSLGIYK